MKEKEKIKFDLFNRICKNYSKWRHNIAFQITLITLIDEEVNKALGT